jgi:hypothetical protein
MVVKAGMIPKGLDCPYSLQYSLCVALPDSHEHCLANLFGRRKSSLEIERGGAATWEP